MRLEMLLEIWRLVSRWGMCWGIGVWSIIGGGMRRFKGRVEKIKADGKGQLLI